VTKGIRRVGREVLGRGPAGAAGAPDLPARAVAGVRAATARRSVVDRVRQRLRPPIQHELRQLEHVLTEAEPWLGIVRDAVGRRWWDDARATAPTSTRSRLSLWNAVSVAALVRSLETG
jgi:hypothetical protein